MNFVKSSVFAAAALVSFSANAFYINATGSYDGKADLKDSNQDVEISSYRIFGGNEFLTLGYKKTEFDWSDGRYNLDSLNYLYADIHYGGAIAGNFTYHAGIGLSSGFEDDCNLPENYSISPRIAFGYKFNQDWEGFAGVATQFNEVENKFLPIIGVKYRDDGALGFSGSIAYPATKATYRFSQFLALNATMLVHQELYQLSDSSNISREGYIFDESVGTSFGVSITPLKMLTIDAGLNTYFNHEYTVYDKNGNELRSIEVDPSAGAYVNVRAAF